MESPRRICGGVRRVVVTEEQRYGPRRLRVNDERRVPGCWLLLQLVYMLVSSESELGLVSLATMQHYV